jgi:hypothetical protein
MTGLFVKKCLGRSSRVRGSAGMMGKSSGAGKCVRPNVCQRTISVSSIDSEPSPIHSANPSDGWPEVWGTWRPAGQSWSSRSVSPISIISTWALIWRLTLGHIDSMSSKGSSVPYERALFWQQWSNFSADELIARWLSTIRVQFARVAYVPGPAGHAIVVCC